jgi:hypothetical protein
MKHPAYHLRVNKTVDRLTLIDAVKRIARLNNLAEYTYYGFGGPYLEDFRLLYEFYPEIKMVSIESDDETFKRQRFHAPCNESQLKLRKLNFKSFLARYDPRDEKSIFWLDYTGLEFGNFEDFMLLLGNVSANSIIKITLRCESTDYIGKDDKQEEFRQKFEEVLPYSYATPPIHLVDFAELLQDMVQIAAQKSLSSGMPMTFHPISSFCYKDGVGMFTLTGVVCQRTETAKINAAFKGWKFANLTWKRPMLIDLPTLSTKERLHLQRRLPCSKGSGRTLRLALGYLIEGNKKSTEKRLKQYADFHRYSPYFMKALP